MDVWFMMSGLTRFPKKHALVLTTVWAVCLTIHKLLWPHVYIWYVCGKTNNLRKFSFYIMVWSNELNFIISSYSTLVTWCIKCIIFYFHWKRARTWSFTYFSYGFQRVKICALILTFINSLFDCKPITMTTYVCIWYKWHYDISVGLQIYSDNKCNTLVTLCIKNFTSAPLSVMMGSVGFQGFTWFAIQRFLILLLGAHWYCAF